MLYSGSDGGSQLSYWDESVTSGYLGAFVATQVQSGYARNGFLVFDYQDEENYKYAGMYESSNDRWVIGERKDGSYHTRASLNESIAQGQWYELQVQVSGDTATLRVGGVVKVAYDFGPGGGILGGKVGLRISNAHSHYKEVTLESFVRVTKYYLFNGQRVAMRRDGVLYYLVGDHLGTTSVVLDASGELVAESRHYPYGGERLPAAGGMPTDYRFTGQKLDGGLGLYVMGARWYDPALARWLSADTLVPDPGDPRSVNRYSYVLGNPLLFVDPSGHKSWKRRYELMRGQMNFECSVGIRQGRVQVENNIETIRSLAVSYGGVDPALVAASIAHQASDINEMPFGIRLDKWVYPKIIGPGADPYDPADAIRGMYAKIANADAKITSQDPSISTTDRYMLLAIAQNNDTAGSPVDTFFEHGRDWGYMKSNRGYGGQWTLQLRRVLLHLEWALSQGWWVLPDGLDLEYWRRIAFSDPGEESK